MAPQEFFFHPSDWPECQAALLDSHCNSKVLARINQTPHLLPSSSALQARLGFFCKTYLLSALIIPLQLCQHITTLASRRRRPGGERLAFLLALGYKFQRLLCKMGTAPGRFRWKPRCAQTKSWSDLLCNCCAFGSWLTICAPWGEKKRMPTGQIFLRIYSS